MKKILILAGNYDPKPDANGVCIKQIVNQFIKKNIEVHVICDGYKDEQNIFDHSSMIHHVLRDRPINYKEMRGAKKYIYFLKRLFLIPVWPLVRPGLAIRYYQLAKKLHIKHGFDAILSVQNPKEAVAAGFKIKKIFPQIKYGVYVLDPVTNSYQQINSVILNFLNKKWEIKIFKKANAIFQLECHRKHYMQDKYIKYQDRIFFLDVPLLLTDKYYKSITKKVKTSKTIKLLYAGSLYYNLREPYYLLNLFKLLICNVDIEVHFYSNGAFDELLKKESNESNSRIISHGYVDTKSLDDAIYESDVLLSIGNSTSEMVPSKIFLYMSSGKPIIHFYNDDEDVCLKYFRMYNNILLINQNNDYDCNLKITLQFLKNNISSIADVKSLKKYFYKNTPEYSALEIIEKLIRVQDKKMK